MNHKQKEARKPASKYGSMIQLVHELEEGEKGYDKEGIPYGLWYSGFDTLEPKNKKMYLYSKDLEGAYAVPDPHGEIEDHAFILLRLANGRFVYVNCMDVEDVPTEENK